MYTIRTTQFAFWVCSIIWTEILFGQIPNFDDFKIYNNLTYPIDKSVSGIYQDHYGFLWFSGSENMYRFDGLNFVSVLDLKDNNFVFPQIQPGRNDILQDHRDRYWFLTPTAIVRWDPRRPSKMAWTKYVPDLNDSIPLPINKMHRMALDSKGFIWVVFDGHDLYKIDPETGKAMLRIDFRIKEHGFRISEIDAMEYNVADNRIYFGADYLRIIAINPDNGKIEYPHLPLRSILKKAGVFNELSKESITDFAKDGTDWWLSLTNNIILRYSFKSGSFKIFRPSTKKNAMIVARIKKGTDGMIWYSDVGSILQMIDPKTNQMFPVIKNPSQEKNVFGNVLDIFFDKNQAMWLATGKCLAKYDPHEHLFREYPPFIAEETTIPQVYYEDKFENEFIGTNKGLFYKLKDENKFSKVSLHRKTQHENSIFTIVYWYKEHYLLGTTNGVFVFDLLKKEIKKLDVSGDHLSMRQYFENPANSIVLDTIGNEPVIWLGSKLRYLYLYHQRTKTIKVIPPEENDPESYHHQVVEKIIRTNSGDVWLATSGGGLSKMIDKNNIRFKTPQHVDHDTSSIQDMNVTDVVTADNNKLWLVTNTGIDIFNQYKFDHLGVLPGMSRSFSALQKGINGEIWSISANELVQWHGDGKILNRYPKGKHNFNSLFFKKNKDIILWESKSHQFTDFTSTSIYVFDSNNEKQLKQTPITVISHFEIGDSDYSHLLFKSKNSLQFNQNNISFSFSCLSYTLSQFNKFAWKLDAMDENWTEPKSQNFITYSSLLPGKYIFRVKSCNAAGIWDEKGGAFAFTILPPYYQTWWFSLIIFVALSLLFWYLFSQSRLRMLALQKAEIQKSIAINTERNRIATDMHDDIGSGLSAIHLFSEYLKSSISGDHPTLSAELDKIIQSSSDLNQKVKEIIWSNEMNESNIIALISSLKIHVQSLDGLGKLHIKLNDSMVFDDLKLTPKEHKNIYLSVKEAINNTLKYADASELDIVIATENSKKIVIDVIDNGIGFDVSYALLHGGNGLKNITSRIKEIGGTIDISSNEDGTKIHFEL